MKPGQKDLYIYLMEESERCRTLEMKRTDAQIKQAVGVAGRTLCNARKKLQEFGLIQCKKGEGNKYRYIICEPVSKQPYPGDPKHPLTCAKRDRKIGNEYSPAPGNRPVEPVKHVFAGVAPNSVSEDRLEQHGVGGIF